MRGVERHCNTDELDALLGVVDPRGRGVVHIDDFLDRYALEYLKSKSARCSLGTNGHDGVTHTLQWPQSIGPEYRRCEELERLRAAKAPPLRSRTSRASRLRRSVGTSTRGGWRAIDLELAAGRAALDAARARPIPGWDPPPAALAVPPPPRTPAPADPAAAAAAARRWGCTGAALSSAIPAHALLRRPVAEHNPGDSPPRSDACDAEWLHNAVEAKRRARRARRTAPRVAGTTRAPLRPAPPEGRNEDESAARMDAWRRRFGDAVHQAAGVLGNLAPPVPAGGGACEASV